MKKYVYLGNRKSTCATQMLTDKENINRSIKSIRSYSRSVRKIKADRSINLKDWETIQTIQTPTAKSNRHSFLPRIDQFKRINKPKVKLQENINCPQQNPVKEEEEISNCGYIDRCITKPIEGFNYKLFQTSKRSFKHSAETNNQLVQICDPVLHLKQDN